MSDINMSHTAFLTKLNTQMSEALDEIANEAVEVARSHCPVKSGRLQASIRKEVNTYGTEAVISIIAGNDRVNYASYVEYGTVPHVIQARNARALRFVVDGRVVYAVKVRHPGTPPHPFLRPSMIWLEQNFATEMKKRLNN